MTIFVEGGVPPSSADPHLTPDSTILLRESFHALFSQKIEPQEFNLIIVPIGGYLNVPALFIPEATKNTNAVALLDFAEPFDDLKKALRSGVAKHSALSFDQTNLNDFRSECVIELGLDGYQERVFFMDREIEAWILSQPDEIEKYGNNEGFTRKRPADAISGHASLKVSHPNVIKDPKTALNTIFIQFFEQQKMSGRKARPYHPAKDGPKLIAMLDLGKLMDTFPDAKYLVEWLLGTPYFLVVFGTPIFTRKRN